MRSMILGLWWMAVGAAACDGGDDRAGGVEADPIGDSGVGLADDDGGLAIVVDGRIVLRTAEQAPRVERQVRDLGEMFFGSFYFTEEEEGRDDAVGLGGVRFEAVAPGVVRGTVAPSGVDATHSALRFACREGGRFAGLGAQVDGFDHRGERVPVWVAEQGNGKLVGATRQDFPMGDVHDSYFPVPWVFDPGGGWGLLVEGTARVVFDFCAADPDAWSVEVRSPGWSFLLVTGTTPLQILERMTGVIGRQTLPNPWALGVWTDAVRGQEAVLHHARALRAAGVPVSAIWSEDWAGHRENRVSGFGLTYHWDVDEELYPDLPGLIAELEGMGIAFLGYFNTFMQQDAPEWDAAVAGGHVVTDDQGEPYVFTAPSLRTASLVDVTRPETRDWMAGHMKAAAELGIRGWMADFAEWLPTDSTTAAGDGWAVHNDYPRKWASLNRQVLEEAFPDGDWIFFSRAGWTGSWTSSPVVWGGDQNTDWEALDGMPSALALGVNLGASGVPFYASDVGGYASLGEVEHRTKELWQRWTEMSAWSPLMRTHHGHEAAHNWQLVESDRTHSDAETLEHFAEFARLHQALYPYLAGLAAEAEAKGWPLMRGAYLHHPDEPGAWRADQYLLGEHILVAPIMEQGATSRTVWLPPGRWAPWKGVSATGVGAVGRLEGPGEAEVTAEIGDIPVFVREGAVIPTYATPPDTLVGWAKGGLGELRGKDAADGELLVHHLEGAPGSFTLADGTVLTPGEEVDGITVTWNVR